MYVCVYVCTYFQNEVWTAAEYSWSMFQGGPCAGSIHLRLRWRHCDDFACARVSASVLVNMCVRECVCVYVDVCQQLNYPLRRSKRDDYQAVYSTGVGCGGSPARGKHRAWKYIH